MNLDNKVKVTLTKDGALYLNGKFKEGKDYCSGMIMRSTLRNILIMFSDFLYSKYTPFTNLELDKSEKSYSRESSKVS